MKYKLLASVLLLSTVCGAQQPIAYDPDRMKVIPDKVFEIGLPLLFLYLVLQVLVSILKTRAEGRIAEKMIAQGFTEEAVSRIFKESNTLRKLQPLKIFLIAAALALSCLLIHFLQPQLLGQSGYLAVGTIFLFLALAFFIYYRAVQRRL
jgi:hypothetical protein